MNKKGRPGCPVSGGEWGHAFSGPELSSRHCDHRPVRKASGPWRVAACRDLRPPTPQAALVTLARFRPPHERKDALTLDSVHGQTEAVVAFDQLVEDLDAWRAGEIAWHEVTSSVLLSGPPGTGKTLLAQAVAGSAAAHFVKTGYAECQKAGHQGDMLKALYAAADQAIAKAPSVFFLDEIDSFYCRGQSSNGYITGVVNGLLILLDRLNATPGMIVIAATNFVENVDPAITPSRSV